MSENHEKKIIADRRDFLKMASLGTVASGAAIVTGNAQADEPEEVTGSGYRETAHVKTYYELAKF